MKHFVIDIDGCISDGKGHPLDISLIKELNKLIHSRYISVSLCTGRSAPYVEAVSQMLNIKKWCICENGAYIYDPITDSVDYHPLITKKTLKSISKIKKLLNTKKFRKICKFELGKEICLSLNPVNIETEELYELLIPVMDETDTFFINHSASSVDITPEGVNKGSALNYIAKKNKYDLANIVAIGDSGGDLPFMKIAGLAACPINSTKEIKENSTYISNKKSTSAVIDIITRFS